MPTRRHLAAALLAAAVLSGLGTASAADAAPRTVSCSLHSGTDLAGRTLTDAQVESRDLRCADLRKADLDGLQLDQVDLSGADLRGASLKNATLTQADLEGTDFTGADLDGATISQASLSGAVLTRVHAVGADFSQVDLTGLSLRGADLQHVDFSQATLRRADLRDADLRDATLDQADVSGARLEGAKLAGSSLVETTGTDVSLDGGAGVFPLDALVALITLLVALIVLVPRIGARHPASAAALAVLLLVAAGAIAEVIVGLAWRPTTDDLIVLPFVTPVVFVAIFVARSLRRPRDGTAAAVLALIGLVGFFLLVAAGLSFLADGLFQILPFQDSCRSAACLAGAARPPVGLALGALLILVAAILGRMRRLTRPAPLAGSWPPAPGAAPRVLPQVTASIRLNGVAISPPPSTSNRPPSQQI